jgi:hypothetical protein
MGLPRTVVLLASVAGITTLAVFSRPQNLVIAADATPAASAPSPDLQAAFQSKIVPLLTQNCYECHGNGNHRGGIALDSFKTVADVESHRDQWQEVLKDVTSGDMPLANAKHQPTPAERKTITEWIERDLYKYDPNNPYPGRVTLHRLNRAEYNNTIRDLLATDMRPADAFPVDDAGYGFDNNGDVLSIAPILMEKYIAAAGKVLDSAIFSDPVVPAPVMHWEAAHLDGTLPWSDPKATTGGGGPFGRSSPIGRVFNYKAEIYTDYVFPKDGTYSLRFRGYGRQRATAQFQIDGKNVGEPVPLTEDMPNVKVYGTDKVKITAGPHRITLAFANGPTKAQYDAAVAAAAAAAAKAATQPSAGQLSAARPAPAVAANIDDVDPAIADAGAANGAAPAARPRRAAPPAAPQNIDDVDPAIADNGAAPAPTPRPRRAAAPAPAAQQNIDDVDPATADAAPAARPRPAAQAVQAQNIDDVDPAIANGAPTPAPRPRVVALADAGAAPGSTLAVGPTTGPTTNPSARGRGGRGGARGGAAGARGGRGGARGGARGGRGGPGGAGTAAMGVIFMEVEGPVDITPDRMSESYRRVFVSYPSDTVTKAQAAEQIVRNFASKAFRRPVTDDEVTQLMALWSQRDASGETFESSIETTLQAVLVSPYFLYRYEQDPTAGDANGVRTIDEYELASRLSYFLWSSMPDDELLNLAKEGKLRANLESQVRRMMSDPKSFALVENFAGQWLQLRQVANVNPDPQRYPNFDESLRDAMIKETQLYFSSIMKEDHSVLEFIDSNYTFLNERLAKHYGISGVTGDDFRKVTLTGNQRGGLITQASILTLTSYPNRTSPVLRGKWVLENLLDAAPPPPPPDVPKLAETAQAEMSGTLRQRMEQHRTNPNCITCHAQMDPIGFGLENYDAIGAWRDRDVNNVVIDASGTLPGGEAFNGASGLKEILEGRKDEFCRCLTDRMLTYALGRGMEVYDRPMEDRITAGLEAKDYKFSALVMQVVQSDAFQKRGAVRGEQ